MSSTLTVIDANTTGAAGRRFELEFPSERVTIRELIRERVYQEVDDFNRRAREGASGEFSGLVQPERRARGATAREVDWKQQFQTACDAFEKTRFIVLVGDRQARALDEMVEITAGLEITFLKLTPLVGG
ncbi:MAG: hypothetical protein JSR77_11185 [Planctomycetes bacterium]|nr:hypothetical protein [Planctomycetota bacterium]